MTGDELYVVNTSTGDRVKAKHDNQIYALGKDEFLVVVDMDGDAE